ncbi:MAG: hypothetical protein ABEI52_11615, partial [Halobacteriaceae archaeon]
MHPFKSTDEASAEAQNKIYDYGLYMYKEDTVLHQWFDKFDINDTYDKVDISLRDNLQWGAGYGQMTAEDYVYSANQV